MPLLKRADCGLKDPSRWRLHKTTLYPSLCPCDRCENTAADEDAVYVPAWRRTGLGPYVKHPVWPPSATPTCVAHIRLDRRHGRNASALPPVSPLAAALAHSHGSTEGISQAVGRLQEFFSCDWPPRPGVRLAVKPPRRAVIMSTTISLAVTAFAAPALAPPLRLRSHFLHIAVKVAIAGIKSIWENVAKSHCAELRSPLLLTRGNATPISTFRSSQRDYYCYMKVFH